MESSMHLNTICEFNLIANKKNYVNIRQKMNKRKSKCNTNSLLFWPKKRKDAEVIKLHGKC
jgi:hypothetical protein